MVARCPEHREGPAHEIIGREMTRGDAFVKFTHATCKCPERQTRRGVDDRHQHAVFGDRSNETETDGAVHDELLTGKRRVQNFELR